MKQQPQDAAALLEATKRAVALVRPQQAGGPNMKEHPQSIWTVGGIPRQMQGVPAPADLESWGASWKAASDDYLVGLAARQYGVDTANSLPALIESQRRLRLAVEIFSHDSKAQTEALIDLVRKSSQQSDTMIRLTRWIIGLTVALGAIAGFQLLAMLKGGA